jgi:hypothetical protein
MLRAESEVGTPDAAVLEIDGRPYPVFWRTTLRVPVQGRVLEIRNTTPDFSVVVDKREFRALGAPRPFLANALGAGVGPALGAAALAAVGAAAGAHVSASVAALLTALLLLLASLKGFLHEVFAHEESLARAQERSAEVAPGEGHGHPHHHGPDTDLPGREAAKEAVGAILAALPDLAELDRTDRVALGEWTGLAGGGAGAVTCGAALALAALLGGLGVHLRRTP